MTLHGAILGIVPGLQSLAIVGHSMSMVPKKIGDTSINPKKIGDTSINPKKMIKGATGILVGTAFIGPTASMIKGL